MTTANACVCDKRDRPATCEFYRDIIFLILIFQFISYILVFYKKICLKKDEVWRKVISKEIVVTLVTQGLPSFFLSRSAA